jgi:hypothetical protein
MISQMKAILKYLQLGRTLTALQALKIFGCARLAARVYDLICLGYDIGKRMVKVKGGARVARYFLRVKV